MPSSKKRSLDADHVPSLWRQLKSTVPIKSGHDDGATAVPHHTTQPSKKQKQNTQPRILPNEKPRDFAKRVEDEMRDEVNNLLKKAHNASRKDVMNETKSGRKKRKMEAKLAEAKERREAVAAEKEEKKLAKWKDMAEKMAPSIEKNVLFGQRADAPPALTFKPKRKKVDRRTSQKLIVLMLSYRTSSQRRSELYSANIKLLHSIYTNISPCAHFDDTHPQKNINKSPRSPAASNISLQGFAHG